MKDINDLIELLTLEKIEVNLYRGQSHSIGTDRVFGGQVLAQSVSAAMQTVPPERIMHSMHAYFILAGDPNHPIIYDVDQLRDGGSFTTRRVSAIQHGRPIFNMACSFHVNEDGYDHQFNMPDVPLPEDLKSDDQIVEEVKQFLPEWLYKSLKMPRPVEFRPVEGISFISPNPGKPVRHVWMKAKGTMPDDPNLHRQALLYASDYNLLTTSLKPHTGDLSKLMLASLDHAMWIHREFRMDDWLLFELDSPSANNARGYTRGNIFNRTGKLIASVVQEGLIRKKY